MAPCLWCRYGNHPPYLHSTSSHPYAQRMLSIREFTTQPTASVMLVSLRAGGLGLNLTMATHVFLLGNSPISRNLCLYPHKDLWWNPATEFQAIDRVHRIGQTKPVHVHRFTIKNTIEDRIKQLQEK